MNSRVLILAAAALLTLLLSTFRQPAQGTRDLADAARPLLSAVAIEAPDLHGMPEAQAAPARIALAVSGVLLVATFCLAGMMGLREGWMTRAE